MVPAEEIDIGEGAWEETALAYWEGSTIPHEVTWNEELCTRGFIWINLGQEVQLCLWTNCYPHLTIFELLTHLLHSGVHFHLMICKTNTFLYCAPNSTLEIAHVTLYSRYYRKKLLRWEKSSHEFFQTWVTRVTDIMRQPHARAYLFEGALLWCIALKFGPHNLILNAISGLSEAVRSYGIGLLLQFSSWAALFSSFLLFMPHLLSQGPFLTPIITIFLSWDLSHSPYTPSNPYTVSCITTGQGIFFASLFLVMDAYSSS